MITFPHPQKHVLGLTFNLGSTMWVNIHAKETSDKDLVVIKYKKIDVAIIFVWPESPKGHKTIYIQQNTLQKPRA